MYIVYTINWYHITCIYIYITGAPEVTANNHATFTIQIQGRLHHYLRLLMGDPVCIHSVVSLKIAAPSSSKKHSVGAMYCNKTVYIDVYMYIHIYIYKYIYLDSPWKGYREHWTLCWGGIETLTKMVPSEQSCVAQKWGEGQKWKLEKQNLKLDFSKPLQPRVHRIYLLIYFGLEQKKYTYFFSPFIVSANYNVIYLKLILFLFFSNKFSNILLMQKL